MQYERPTIISRAHEWIQDGKEGVLCLRCGAKTVIGEWGIPRCTPHSVFADSGFADETEIHG